MDSFLSFVSKLYRTAFPERQLYIRSEGGVKFLVLSPIYQLLMFLSLSGLLIWFMVAVVSSYIYDARISSRDLALIEVEEVYKMRIEDYKDRYAELEMQRDDSELKFSEVMRQLDEEYIRTVESVSEEVALKAKLDAITRRLDEVTEQRDAVVRELSAFSKSYSEMEKDIVKLSNDNSQLKVVVASNSQVIKKVTGERDIALSSEKQLSKENFELKSQLADLREYQGVVMTKIEDAVETSLTKVNKVLKTTGVDVRSLVGVIKSSYNKDELLRSRNKDKETDDRSVSISGTEATDDDEPYDGEGLGGPFFPARDDIHYTLVKTPMGKGRIDSFFANMISLNTLRSAIEVMPIGKVMNGRYRMTSGYGYRRDPFKGSKAFHRGIDYAAPKGTSIFTPMYGKVVYAGRKGNYGNVVKIDHPLGFRTLYAHMSSVSVSVGDYVDRGDVVGKVGNTGRSTGSHLHYELHFKGKSLNPYGFVAAGDYVIFEE